MKKSIVILITLLFSFSCTNIKTKKIALSQKVIESKVMWTGQSSLIFFGNTQKIAIDPFEINTNEKVDILLITHKHNDHLSPEEIKKVITDKTIILAAAESEKGLAEFKNKIIYVEPNKEYTVNGINIKTVPAYNTNKKYHKKEKNWVGYIVNLDGVKYYHSGDTQRIPEMKNLDCDVIFIPMGQTYTMDSVDEAVEAVKDTNAKFAIPFHFGKYEGKIEDAEEFVKNLNSSGKVKAFILQEK